jgi:hypothetical protein
MSVRTRLSVDNLLTWTLRALSMDRHDPRGKPGAARPLAAPDCPMRALPTKGFAAPERHPLFTADLARLRSRFCST